MVFFRSSLDVNQNFLRKQQQIQEADYWETHAIEQYNDVIGLSISNNWKDAFLSITWNVLKFKGMKLSNYCIHYI